jgi:hypothetical protein
MEHDQRETSSRPDEAGSIQDHAVQLDLAAGETVEGVLGHVPFLRGRRGPRSRCQAGLERVCLIATSMGTSQPLVQPIYLS